MSKYVDNKPRNCNHCVFRQDISQHWDKEDYCLLSMKRTSKIDMDKDCPLNKNYKINR